MRVVAAFFVLALAIVAGEEEGAPVVKTDVGEISGIVEHSTKGYQFNSYYGIPFGKAPVGELRFKDPVKADPWEGVWDGSKQPPYCPHTLTSSFFKGQLEVVGQEDCLFLNVFTTKPNSPLARLPVMVYIHGGAYSFGGAQEYPPYALLNHDIVLVVIQYRLGLLGFLSTEDEEAPGNLGLKDQVLALKWVQDNIHNFGGDPTKVTLFGESAGASSAHLLMLSPYVLGLFKRVILQSGSALTPWALGGAHLEVANYTANFYECPTNQTTKEIVKCLQGIDVEKLVSMQPHFFVWYIFPLLFGPRVDGSFIPHDPEKLVKEGRHKKIDLMAGITANEGGMFSCPLFGNEPLRSALRFNFEEAAPISLEFTEGDISPLNQTLRIFDHYLGGINFNEYDADNVTQMYGDRHFVIPHDLMTLHYARNAPQRKVFRYEFRHRGQASFCDLYGLEFGKDWVTHADDLYYIFEGGPLLAPMENEEDKKMRDLMTTLWTNFATVGDPTPDETLDVKWEPVKDGNLRYLALSLTPTMEDDTREEVREFWSSLPSKQNLILHPDKVKNLVKTPIEQAAEEESPEATKAKEEEASKTEKTEEAASEDKESKEEPVTKTEGEAVEPNDDNTKPETPTEGEKNKVEL